MIQRFLPSDIAEVAVRIDDDVQALGGKTVVLSGAAGFLGRYFVAAFAHLNARVLEQPVRLVALDNVPAPPGGGKARASKHTRFVSHDIREPFDPGEPVHYVIHAAGIASPLRYRAAPIATLEVATIGTKNALDLARANGARFLFFSSSEIYGDPDPAHVPTAESYRGNVACQGPRACYDESKRLGETLAYLYGEQFGVHANVVRPFNIFGPGLDEQDFRVLPNFASRIKARRSLQVYGSGAQTRTYCYVSDALVGFFLTLLRGQPGETYNIGNPQPELSIVDLVARIESVIGRKLEKEIVNYPSSYPADEPNRRCPDITKAQRELGYMPTVELDEGLRRFLDWSDGAYTGLGAA